MRTRTLVAALLLGAAASPALGQAYTFTKVLDREDGFRGFGFPSLNNNGQVAFFGEPDNRRDGIFVADASGLVRTVAQQVDFGTLDEWGPTINDNATVVFSGRRGFYDGIYAAKAGQPYRLLASTETTFDNFRADAGPVINNADTVAFWGRLNSGATAIHTVSADGGPLSLAAGGDRQTLQPDRHGHALTDDGKLAYTGTAVNGDGRTRVYVTDGAAPTAPGQDDSTSVNSFVAPALNDAGTLVYGTIQSALFAVSPDGQRRRVDDDPDAYQFIDNFDINDGGTIAFEASRDLPGGLFDGTGIYTGGDPESDRVIAPGDSLFGGTVAGVGFSRGLNDRGQIAFVYSLFGTGGGIAIATPVPEPAAAATLALAGVALLARRRRRPSKA